MLASAIMLLVLTRMLTVPSDMGVKVMRSPGLMPRLSRISFGMVVWPLLVRVASVLMGILRILTKINIVRNGVARNTPFTRAESRRR